MATNNRISFSAIHKQLAEKFSTPNARSQEENVYSPKPRPPRPPIHPKLKNRLSLFKGKSEANQIPPPDAENIDTIPKPLVPPKPKHLHNEVPPAPNIEDPEIQPIVSLQPWYFKFKKYIIFLLVPLRMCLLYYMDILSDIMQSIGLYMNCHPRYFSVSISIVFTSYLITVLYVRLVLRCSWSRSIFYFVVYG